MLYAFTTRYDYLFLKAIFLLTLLFSMLIFPSSAVTIIQSQTGMIMNGKIKKRIAVLSQKTGIEWKIAPTVKGKGKHIQLISDVGRLFMSKTPSDRRADLNLISTARRMARGEL